MDSEKATMNTDMIILSVKRLINMYSGKRMYVWQGWFLIERDDCKLDLPIWHKFEHRERFRLT